MGRPLQGRPDYEHPAVLALGKELERRGYTVVQIPVDSKGRLDMECAEEMIDTDTAVVSIMWANNETGNLYPVAQLAEMAQKAAQSDPLADHQQAGCNIKGSQYASGKFLQPEEV